MIGHTHRSSGPQLDVVLNVHVWAGVGLYLTLMRFRAGSGWVSGLDIEQNSESESDLFIQQFIS